MAIQLFEHYLPKWSFFLNALHGTFQFCSVAQSCLTLCDPMSCSTPGLPVQNQLPEPTQTHVHWVGDAIQPSHPLSSPSPSALNLSHHQGLFKWVSSSHQFGVSASSLVFPMNIRDWFPLGLTSLISLLPKGLSQKFSLKQTQTNWFKGNTIMNIKEEEMELIKGNKERH